MAKEGGVVTAQRKATQRCSEMGEKQEAASQSLYLQGKFTAKAAKRGVAQPATLLTDSWMENTGVQA